MSASHAGQFTISKCTSKGINHERFTYKPSTKTFTLKTTKGAGKSKKQHIIEAQCNLEEYIRKHVSKDLGLQLPCPGSPFGFLSGKAVPRDKNRSQRWVRGVRRLTFS